IVDWVGLKDRIHHKVGTYSHGMRQRLGLAQALLPRPEFLLLDEPTDGLDPEGIVEFRDKILELRERLGLTVLLSSHLLSEVDQICDQIVILRKGKLVFDGPIGELTGKGNLFRIKAENTSLEDIAKAASALGAKLNPGGFITLPPEVSAAELLQHLVVTKKIKVTEFTPQNGSLEAVYLDINQKEDSAV
ncbi:MAG: ABC transporter ATP-binding protein, partial [Verrucomicrobiales bacterium]|nr:ABC transporter ATP-binding protein [Verrucomicrobiales bacterium]